MKSSASDTKKSAPEGGLLIASHIYPHHSPTSGYGQLCSYLPGRKLLSTDELFGDAEEGRLRWRINQRLFDLRILRESRHAKLLHALYAENHPSPLFPAIRRLNPAIKLAGTFHLPLGYRSMKKSQAMLDHFDGIIALTSSQAEEIRRIMPGKKVWFIPHGVIHGPSVRRPTCASSSGELRISSMRSSWSGPSKRTDFRNRRHTSPDCSSTLK